MKIKLMEYNVTPNIDERYEFNIIFDSEFIMYNNQKIIDSEKINKIINLFEQYKEKIIKLNNENVTNYKGGSQKSLFIQYEDGLILQLIGNTPSIEMSNLYYELKDKLIIIIEK